jgi:hypothetical protein
VLVWAAAVGWGRALSTTGPVPLRPRDGVGALAAVGFFLMLRVFDEHKDYAADCIAHPGRVLQRGFVTLGHLKVVGAVAIALQLGASFLFDGGNGPVTLSWLATFAWSLLMAKEFFVGAWLRPRLPLYALSHMIVMPLAVRWMVQMGADRAPLSPVAWMLPVVSYLTGFAFEIARKLKAPADERPEVDSYTRAFGTRRAPLVLAFVLTAALMGFAAMLRVTGAGWTTLAGDALLAVILAMAWMALLRFRSRPLASTAKACESTVGLAIAVSHLLLVVVIGLGRGTVMTRESYGSLEQPDESRIIHLRVVAAVDGDSRQEPNLVKADPREWP